MTVAIACDHTAIELKQAIISVIEEAGLEYRDFGTNDPDRADYPVFGRLAAEAVASGECDRGIILCGSGIGISMEALFQRASKLPRIELVKTPNIICRNTVSAMQAGIYYGFVGQIDEIVKRIKEELNEQNVKVIATGGLATLIAKSSSTIDIVDPMLTLKGLLILYEKNKNEGGRK